LHKTAGFRSLDVWVEISMSNWIAASRKSCAAPSTSATSVFVGMLPQEEGSYLDRIATSAVGFAPFR
jgi:hypothetical protein